MCAISGYINFKDNFIPEAQKHRRTVHEITRTLRHRGPDGFGEWIGEHAAFGNSRLATIDSVGGVQPMERTVAGYQFVITYNGELYNAKELKNTLLKYGYRFTTSSDTEVLLYTYIHYGADCAEKLNGIYAFCIWDSMRQRIFMCRDRFGVKPLFYARLNDTIIFASEQKAILSYPGFKSEVSKEGLCEIFALSPFRTQGIGVFERIQELKPGRFMTITRDSMKIKQYYSLKAKEHTDSMDDTKERLRHLITDSVKRQIVSDVPMAALLSGGLDSNIISAICADEMQKNGFKLSTYSFDYKCNDKYFRAPTFQPDSDAPWIKRTADVLGTDHQYLVCDNDIMLDYLNECVDARDLPSVADTDASLLFFCRTIKKRHCVILSGECSDVAREDYSLCEADNAPDFHSFPWSYSSKMRNDILLPEVRRTLDLDAYTAMRYAESLEGVSVLEDDKEEDIKRRTVSWLNINWSMTNLLERKDRMAMASGVEMRMPFCDHRIIEYLYNIPWSIQSKTNLLYESMKDMLPTDALMHKKNHHLKVYNPDYEQMVRQMMLDTIADANAPILALCDRKKIEMACQYETAGQWLDGAQFIGFLLQVNYWLKHYRIRIV